MDTLFNILQQCGNSNLNAFIERIGITDSTEWATTLLLFMPILPNLPVPNPPPDYFTIQSFSLS